MPLGGGAFTIGQKKGEMAPPQTPANKKLISDLEHCAEKGEIGHDDSVMFNEALMTPDEERI